MNPITRLALSLCAGLLCYVVFWTMVTRHHNVRLTWWARSADERQLRSGAGGFLRLLLAWGIAFFVYAVVVESYGVPLSRAWWRESIYGGDWIGVLISGSLFAVAEWSWVRRSPGAMERA